MNILRDKRYCLIATLLVVVVSLFRFSPLEAASPSDNFEQKMANSSAEINVSIDWDSIIRKIPSYAYGINSPANFIPEFSNNVSFMNTLEFITQKKGFIRLHGWGMLGNSPEAWQNNGVWDSTKIEQALRPLVEDGYTIMINIPSGALGEEDFQDPVRFAKFCADLVKIVNIDHQLGIKYWEIPNERESGFIDSGLSVSDMSTLIQTASQAMKAVDPTIKVGGPATAWVNVDYISELVKQSYPVIDFISVHSYSGDGSNDVHNTYDIAQEATDDLARIRADINQITGDDYLPLFLTEYNIAYQTSPRMRTNQGAVYNAIILTESVKAGADASMYWAMAPYSDMSLIDGDTHEENIHLFEIFNQSFHGNLVNSLSDSPEKIISYAASDQADSEQHSFAIINRTASPQLIKLNFNNWLPSNLVWHLWDNDSDFTTRTISWSELNEGSIVLSAYSVNLFVEKSDEIAPPSAGGGSFSVDLMILFLALFLRVQRFTRNVRNSVDSTLCYQK